MGIEIKGLKELQRKITSLSNQIASLNGEHSVGISDVLTPAFLSKCSRFKSVEELFRASGFKVDSQEDFNAIPADQWDAFIKENTSFSTWKDMAAAAAVPWFQEKLGL